MSVACVKDYMLAYSLRKYAGVRSYVVPMDLRDSQTWGNMDVEWDMQNQVTRDDGGTVFYKGTARSLEQRDKKCIKCKIYLAGCK